MTTPFERKRAEAKRVNDNLRARVRQSFDEVFALYDTETPIEVAPGSRILPELLNDGPYGTFIRRHLKGRTYRFRANDDPDPLTIPAYVPIPEDAIVDRIWKDKK